MPDTPSSIAAQQEKYPQLLLQLYWGEVTGEPGDYVEVGDIVSTGRLSGDTNHPAR